MTLRLRGRDPETPAEHLQCMPGRVPIERVFPTDVDLRHERDEVAHGGDLRLLVGRNELEHAHDLRDGGQRGKGALLHLQLCSESAVASAANPDRRDSMIFSSQMTDSVPRAWGLDRL